MRLKLVQIGGVYLNQTVQRQHTRKELFLDHLNRVLHTVRRPMKASRLRLLLLLDNGTPRHGDDGGERAQLAAVDEGAAAVAATAANARLFADGASVFKFKKYQNEDERHYMVKVGAVVLLVLAFIIYWVFGKPVSLVFMGAFAQGALLPFLAFAAIYFLYTRVDRKLHPGKVWKVFLTLSAICMAIIGSYGAFNAVKDRFFTKKIETPAAAEAAPSTNAAPAAVEQPKE